MSDFVVKDSGQRVDYATGARRDTDSGKPRYDLISAYALTRLAHHLRKGAEKYGDRNWEKGIPNARLLGSLLRHVYQYAMGDRTEDHLSAVVFNAMALVHFEEVPGGNPADASPPPPVRKLKNRTWIHTTVPDDRWHWNHEKGVGEWIMPDGTIRFESRLTILDITTDPSYVEVFS